MNSEIILQCPKCETSIYQSLPLRLLPINCPYGCDFVWVIGIRTRDENNLVFERKLTKEELMAHRPNTGKSYRKCTEFGK